MPSAPRLVNSAPVGEVKGLASFEPAFPLAQMEASSTARADMALCLTLVQTKAETGR